GLLAPIASRVGTGPRRCQQAAAGSCSSYTPLCHRRQPQRCSLGLWPRPSTDRGRDTGVPVVAPTTAGGFHLPPPSGGGNAPRPLIQPCRRPGLLLKPGRDYGTPVAEPTPPGSFLILARRRSQNDIKQPAAR